ncbi:MGMT family protein [Nocardioides salarius]|uniref:MGMT family protein n=1 Tax=Nocardioides salarius TaxID=374513 RepID=UPI0030F637F8
MTALDDANAVYDACASVPAGMVITYGDLAKLVGRPTTHARNVANLLGHRPDAGTSADPLPWWRVVRADGSMLDADQINGPREQWVNNARNKLADEGVPMTADGRVNMATAVRMLIPEDIAPRIGAKKPKAVVAASDPCWKHDKFQYSCRDCTA